MICTVCLGKKVARDYYFGSGVDGEKVFYYFDNRFLGV